MYDTTNYALSNLRRTSSIYTDTTIGEKQDKTQHVHVHEDIVQIGVIISNLIGRRFRVGISM